MKKGKRLLILTAVLAVFIAGALVLKSVNEAREAGEKAAVEKPVVFALDKDNLTEISYTYQGETLRFEKAEDHWRYAEDVHFPLKESMVTAMADAIKSVTASRKVADTLENAQEYGFKEPAVTVTATLADGTKQTLCLGGKNSTTGDIYAYAEGSRTVYTVAPALLGKFSYSLYGLITEEAFPDIETASIGRLSYSAADRNLTLENYPQGSEASYSSMYTWFLREADGRLSPLESDKVSVYLDGVAGITATRTVDYDAAEEELAAYGLHAPAAFVTVDYTVSHQETVPKATFTLDPALSPLPLASPAAPREDAANASPSPADAPTQAPEAQTVTVTEPRQITVFFGNRAEDGSYYMRHTDSRRVFLVSEDTFSKLSALAVENLLPTQVCLIPIDSVDGLTVTMNGQVYDFAIRRTAVTGEDGKTATDTVYTLGDAEIGESAFKSFYTALISLEREQKAAAAPAGPAYLTVDFHRNTENFQEMTLTLYPYDGSFYMAEFNGETGILLNKREVESLVSSLTALAG